MNDCVNTFFGSNGNTFSKSIHNIGSQFGTQRQSLSLVSSGTMGSKNSFALKKGQIGDGGMSVKNYIDCSRDLTMLKPGQATAFATHLRNQDSSTLGNSTYGSAQGSKFLMTTMGTIA